jgi:hypothetical protein
LAVDSIGIDDHGGIVRAAWSGAGRADDCSIGITGRSKAVGVVGVSRHSR